MTDVETLEILKDLRALPSDKVAEARDFIAYLRERYGKSETVDESDEWTDEDYSDFALSSFAYFEENEQEGEAAK